MLGISSGNHPRLHSQPLGVRGGGTARRSPSRIRNGRGPISDCVGFADKGGVRARPPSGIPPDLVASNHLSESYISSPNVSVLGTRHLWRVPSNALFANYFLSICLGSILLPSININTDGLTYRLVSAETSSGILIGWSLKVIVPNEARSICSVALNST